jgi:hypothetical protein
MYLQKLTSAEDELAEISGFAVDIGFNFRIIVLLVVF